MRPASAFPLGRAVVGRCLTATSVQDQVGTALPAVLIVSTLLASIGAGLLLLANTEVKVASAHHDGVRALYAADAALELSVSALAQAGDLSAVLAGAERSAFVDGPPTGVRPLGGGFAVDLDARTNRLRCGFTRPCSGPEMDAVTATRPWGTNNPRWQPFLHDPIANWLPDVAVDQPVYVVVWVGDDSRETDGDPTRDGLDEATGRGVVSLIAEASSVSAHRAIQAVVSLDAGRLRVHSWKELR